MMHDPPRRHKPISDPSPLWEVEWYKTFRKALGAANRPGVMAFPEENGGSVALLCTMEFSPEHLRLIADALEAADAQLPFTQVRSS